jgi:hypothetical protein
VAAGGEKSGSVIEPVADPMVADALERLADRVEQLAVRLESGS